MADPSDSTDSRDDIDPRGASDPPDPVDRVERRLATEHADVLDGLSACADAVAGEWGGDRPDGETATERPPRTTDRAAVVPGFRRALDASGLLAHLPSVLSDLVTVAGRAMPAPPVAAPPYVVVTSEGVVLRASLGEERLVVSLRVFDVDRSGDETGYVRREGVDSIVEFR